MTKEQGKAIERLEKRIKDNEDYKTTQVWLTDDVSAVYTVLNMLKEKDREIERLRYIKESFDYVVQKETEKKDKQIDLMAEFIFQNIDVEEEICNSAYIECKQETAQDITCINCIKQYFERKSEEC